LRGPKQDCAENPNEISPFNPELVLRDIPGKSAQWRQPQRFGRLIVFAALLDSAGDEIVRIPIPPPADHTLVDAIRLVDRVETIGGTHNGSLWSIRHGDP